MKKIIKSPPLLLYYCGNLLFKLRIPILPLLISWFNRFIFSAWIPSSAKIGKNLTLGYWGLGVVIHSNTKIGDNCLVAQNVTIGRNLGDTKVPEIGNDVYIGAGSVVFGEIKIGDNVIIGSNSVINKDVPPNVTVVGSPMRIIQKNRVLKYYEIDKRE